LTIKGIYGRVGIIITKNERKKGRKEEGNCRIPLLLPILPPKNAPNGLNPQRNYD